jgi:hypothetical protein
MGSPLFHVGALASCPHQGQITTVKAGLPRVLVSGQPVATVADQFVVAGCVFTVPPGKPQPCVTARWLMPATRVLVDKSPAVLQSSTGICQSAEQIPAGPPSITTTQMRVSGL